MELLSVEDRQVLLHPVTFLRCFHDLLYLLLHQIEAFKSFCFVLFCLVTLDFILVTFDCVLVKCDCVTRHVTVF